MNKPDMFGVFVQVQRFTADFFELCQGLLDLRCSSGSIAQHGGYQVFISSAPDILYGFTDPGMSMDIAIYPSNGIIRPLASHAGCRAPEGLLGDPWSRGSRGIVGQQQRRQVMGSRAVTQKDVQSSEADLTTSS